MGAQDKARKIVGISDMKCSFDTGSCLITYALGSCIGVVVYDPKKHIGGMLHFQLASSKAHKDLVKENPFMFADVGVPLLLENMRSNGSNLDHTIIGIYGGASVLDNNGMFKIGVQNIRMVKKILWQQCLRISNEDVGGNKARTVRLDIETGHIQVEYGENRVMFG